ncbi:MAG: hypothetical protein RLZZ450_7306 [Pseudomonadota bacterium]|jgi:hypothetical protein
MRVALLAALLAALAAPAAHARADSATTCRTDSGGHRICVERQREPAQRCTTTCRVDSGGHTVCREICR